MFLHELNFPVPLNQTAALSLNDGGIKQTSIWLRLQDCVSMYLPKTQCGSQYSLLIAKQVILVKLKLKLLKCIKYA